MAIRLAFDQFQLVDKPFGRPITRHQGRGIHHLWPFQPEGRATAAVRERLREMLTDNYQLHHDEQLQSRELEPAAVGRLGDVHVPTLVIIGGLDFSGTIASMGYLAEHIADAREVVFSDTAHMVNMEQPARFNAAVLDFLGEI